MGSSGRVEYCNSDVNRPPDQLSSRLAQLEEQFTRLGPVAVQFFAGLMAGQRQGKHQAHKILTLLTVYGRADIQAALERAVRYGAYSFAAVERILAVHARPKTVLEALADAEPPPGRAWLGEPVPPRPISYATAGY